MSQPHRVTVHMLASITGEHPQTVRERALTGQIQVDELDTVSGLDALTLLKGNTSRAATDLRRRIAERIRA